MCQGIPGFLATVEVIVRELKVDKFILAEEIKSANPDLFESLIQLSGNTAIEFIPHEEFKARSHNAKAIIRTGEFSAYANVILVSGVVF